LRVCLLTGGGDAPGLNAVIRGFVRRAVQLGIDVYGSQDGFEGLVEPGRVVHLTLDSVRGILQRGGSILGCSNRSNPFHYVARKDRMRPHGDPAPPSLDQSAVVTERLREHAVDVLVLAGGDGTMELAHRFSQLGVACVGIPKTIDNDLLATDQTFGFDTAVNTATAAIDALHSTAASHERVMILEVMGRYTGWIALHAGLAGGADVILIPEIPYDVTRVVGKIREREGHGLPFTIVVVAEGARPVGGAFAEVEAGTTTHLPRLGGAGERLLYELAACNVEHEVRVTVLGHLQRGGTPSAFDRVLGTRMGIHAADLCAAGAFGQMVCLRGTAIAAAPIEDAVGRPKLVDPNGQLVAAARGVGIELGG
jgi:ATP-dependent phosphofructokinase / diphosphate-dependent phosphofructokinase